MFKTCVREEHDTTNFAIGIKLFVVLDGKEHEETAFFEVV